jgi:hypothetical protein
MPSTVDHATAFSALHLLSAATAPFNFRFDPVGCAYVLGHSAATAVIIDASLAPADDGVARQQEPEALGTRLRSLAEPRASGRTTRGEQSEVRVSEDGKHGPLEPPVDASGAATGAENAGLISSSRHPASRASATSTLPRLVYGGLRQLAGGE